MTASQTPSRNAWRCYLETLTQGDTQPEIAQRTGISQATISRWLRGLTTPEAPAVTAVARAYDRNVLEALVAAGALTLEEAAAGVSAESRTLLTHLDARQRMLADVEAARAAILSMGLVSASDDVVAQMVTGLAAVRETAARAGGPGASA